MIVLRVLIYLAVIALITAVVAKSDDECVGEGCDAPAPLARVPTALDPPAPQVIVNPPDLCDGPAAAMRLEVAKVGMSVPSYPCEVIRTYEAVDATQGKGFWMGTVPRAFLKVRLISKGLFSALFGIFGLG